MFKGSSGGLEWCGVVGKEGRTREKAGASALPARSSMLQQIHEFWENTGDGLTSNLVIHKHCGSSVYGQS